MAGTGSIALLPVRDCAQRIFRLSPGNVRELELWQEAMSARAPISDATGHRSGSASWRPMFPSPAIIPIFFQRCGMANVPWIGPCFLGAWTRWSCCGAQRRPFPSNRSIATTGGCPALSDVEAGRHDGPVSRQPPKSLSRMLPPLAQNTNATPISEPPATTPDATGKVNSSATFGLRRSSRSATRAPRKNKSP
jgi:hypothetical protein